ncbi:hypothetical protein [Gorillibacterium massiliense]|uniref:hypothetical protein n=1 Tax=Gorillibacterium massiliense TaxID=1280390 RepID=UPI0004AF13B3|nr:hypothetical protein [Gorillibacterium massiliense]
MADQDHSIYVLLTDTGTWFTKVIGLYTKANWNHASIAFDAELRDVYSFGRKHPANPLSGGFVKENLHTGILFQSASCAIYRCPVSQSQYNRIRECIRMFEQNRDIYKYNLLGLIGLMLNIAYERKNAFFCTQFVAMVMGNSGIPLSEKPYPFVTPVDILNSRVLQPVYQGSLQTYVNKEAADVLMYG